MVRFFFAGLWLIVLLASCTSNKNGTADLGSGEAGQDAVATVKITGVVEKIMADTVTLPGNTQFLKKISIESPISGYVKSLNVNVGDIVAVNETMMTLQTKEAAAFERTANDSLFTKGIIP